MAVTNETVQIGEITLIWGDAFDHLPRLRGHAHVLCTDHPYRLTSGGVAAPGEGPMSGKFDPDAYDNSGDLMQMAEWNRTAGPIYRALKANADAYIMVNDKNIQLAWGAFQGAGFKFHNMLAWNKGAPTRNRWYMKNLEYTLYMWKGRASTIRRPGSTQLYQANRPPEKYHPTQKPIELMRHYISNSAKFGQCILDPYMGSGTTMVAAAMEGMSWGGIESNRAYFDTSCQRVREAVE